MYPYPSGALHIGHWYIKTPTDAIARYQRMHGYNVFLPIGFDAFGLPAENAAIKNNINPRDWTMANIEKMRGQLRTMGATFAWDAEVVTCDPEYYRWNQWMFLQFLKKGLAYRKVSPVDWCPNDGTLAREQVEGTDRRCWRCGAKVEKRELAQWYLRHHRVRGRPAGLHGHRLAGAGQADADELDRALVGRRDRVRDGAVRAPRRRRGAAGLHDAPGHAVRRDVHGPGARARAGRDADRAGSPGRGRRLRARQAAAKTEIDRLSTDREKTGVAIGADAINPVNGERIPIFIADYVLGTYGTGAIMAVPAHDERDFAFAQAFGLPIVKVVMPKDADPDQELTAAFTEHTVDEVMVNSGRFTGRPAAEAWHDIVKWLGEQGKGEQAVTYRLRDWLISRQRYWGTPIPVIHCAACGPVPVPEADLPVLLPETVDYRGSGDNPLTRDEDVPDRGLPAVRRGRAARDGHDGHVHRLVLVLVPLPLAAQRRGPGGRGPRQGLDPRRPVHGRRRARGDAPALQPVLHQGDARPGAGARARAVLPAVQPGPDPGRRRRADEQEPRQRRGPRRAGRALRRRRRPAVPDVHGPLGPGRPVERRRASAAPRSS